MYIQNQPQTNLSQQSCMQNLLQLPQSQQQMPTFTSQPLNYTALGQSDPISSLVNAVTQLSTLVRDLGTAILSFVRPASESSTQASEVQTSEPSIFEKVSNSLGNIGDIFSGGNGIMQFAKKIGSMAMSVFGGPLGKVGGFISKIF